MENNPWHISLGRGPIGPKRKKIIARPWLLQKTTLPLKILLSTYIGKSNFLFKISPLDGAHSKTILLFLSPILIFLKFFENITTKVIEITVF